MQVLQKYQGPKIFSEIAKLIQEYIWDLGFSMENITKKISKYF
jgi:hypothetical protein